MDIHAVPLVLCCKELLYLEGDCLWSQKQVMAYDPASIDGTAL